MVIRGFRFQAAMGKVFYHYFSSPLIITINHHHFDSR